jgi:hypothetical protein
MVHFAAGPESLPLFYPPLKCGSVKPEFRCQFHLGQIASLLTAEPRQSILPSLYTFPFGVHYVRG